MSDRDVPGLTTLQGPGGKYGERLPTLKEPDESIHWDRVKLRTDGSLNLGDQVGKGQQLCAIGSRDAAAAAAEHVESHKDLELAEKTSAMTQDLFDHQAASRIALQQAQSELAKARSHVARAEQALHVLGLGDEDAIAGFNGRLPIRSPIAGTVIERRVIDGQFVQTDSAPIITVANLSAVWVLGDLFERDVHLVRLGQQAAITAAAYPGERFEGRVDYVSSTIDPATRTAKLRVSVPNPGGRLKAEMFASVAVALAELERVIAVPSRAVFMEGGRAFVYVAVGPDRFVRRPVEIGPDAGDDRRVTSGLSAGERIVVDGAVLLRQEEERKSG